MPWLGRGPAEIFKVLSSVPPLKQMGSVSLSLLSVLLTPPSIQNNLQAETLGLPRKDKERKRSGSIFKSKSQVRFPM